MQYAIAPRDLFTTFYLFIGGTHALRVHRVSTGMHKGALLRRIVIIK